MMHPMVTQEINEAVTVAKSIDDLDDACRHIQDAFASTDGGIAGLFATELEDGKWPTMATDDRAKWLTRWITHELEMQE